MHAWTTHSRWHGVWNYHIILRPRSFSRRSLCGRYHSRNSSASSSICSYLRETIVFASTMSNMYIDVPNLKRIFWVFVGHNSPNYSKSSQTLYNNLTQCFLPSTVHEKVGSVATPAVAAAGAAELVLVVLEVVLRQARPLRDSRHRPEKVDEHFGRIHHEYLFFSPSPSSHT